MSCTIRDASLTTARRRQLALYSWRRNAGYSGNPNSVRTEQRSSYGSKQTGSTGDVPVQAYVGAQLVGQAVVPPGEFTCDFPAPYVTLAGYSKNGYADVATQH